MQPLGMTAGLSIAAMRGQGKALEGAIDCAGLETWIKTEDWQDDVAARPHTGLPLYMRVSPATCWPTL